ncbi:uncharacterized protein LOC112348418 [Selaginella moellendorffii]|uniref:uncharacterized protein LOC112348418 n=1 Tax=Selaginella moellendorffii TaxID=88036 RepID=UPI000D1D0B92|nr:uncharacterized protein LOC112348418 [Selaginella moellendorffii]|eukprot:XP_024536592.1 uncharacterized protein LOC112348418 [Selaginella moellendorffii]
MPPQSSRQFQCLRLCSPWPTVKPMSQSFLCFEFFDRALSALSSSTGFSLPLEDNLFETETLNWTGYDTLAKVGGVFLSVCGALLMALYKENFKRNRCRELAAGNSLPPW